MHKGVQVEEEWLLLLRHGLKTVAGNHGLYITKQEWEFECVQHKGMKMLEVMNVPINLPAHYTFCICIVMSPFSQ
jgi:hypothetical protein